MNKHDRCQMLLPWYANGTLNEAEMALCDTHLKDCNECRAELSDTVEQMRKLNQQRPVTLDAEAGATALMAHLQPTEVRKSGTHWPIALAATAVLSCALLATVTSPSRGYQLLSDPPPQVTGSYVQLIFHPGTPEEDIRTFMRSSGGTVQGNPTAAGVYRLRFDSDITSEMIDRLRAHPSIAWANTEL